MHPSNECQQQALDKIATIATKAAGCDYIFCGENQDRNERIKSRLYRECEDTNILDQLGISTI